MEPQVLLVASSTEGNITAWDVATGTALTTYKANASPANSLALLGRDYLVALQLGKGSIHAWAWHKDHVHQRSFAPEPLAAVACTPDGVFCAAGGLSGAIFIWETSSGRLLKSWPAHYKAVSCLAFSDDGSVLVSGGQDTLVNAWLLAEVLDASAAQQLQVGGAVLQPLHSWSDHTLPVTALAVGAGGVGAMVASASLDRSVKIRSLGQGLLLRTVALPVALHSLALDPGEHAIYAGSSSGAIYEIDLVQGQEAQQLASEGAGGLGPAGGLGLPAGGPGRPGGAVGQAAPPSGAAAVLEGHSQRVTCLALTGDGSLLLSGSEDQSVRVWDLRSRQQVRRLPNPAKGPVTGLLVVDWPPFMQVGGAHLAPASSAAAGGRKGPKRPQPLAAFSKYPNAPGVLKHWEGGLVVIDGSCAVPGLDEGPLGLTGAAPPPGVLGGGGSGTWWQSGAAAGDRAAGAGRQGAAGGVAPSSAGHVAGAGREAEEADALREENDRLRQQLAQATSLAVRWGQLNGQLQQLCTENLLLGDAQR